MSQQKNQTAVPRRSPCPVMSGLFAETSAAIAEKSQQTRLEKKTRHIAPGVDGSLRCFSKPCLLRLLRNRSGSLCTIGGPATARGPSRYCLLRVLLRLHRNRSRSLSKTICQRFLCPGLLGPLADGFAETSAAISGKSQHHSQQAVQRWSPGGRRTADCAETSVEISEKSQQTNQHPVLRWPPCTVMLGFVC